MKYPQEFKSDWEALEPKGRIYYRKMYRELRRRGAMVDHPEDRQTARDHLQMILHIDRNRAYSISQIYRQ